MMLMGKQCKDKTASLLCFLRHPRVFGNALRSQKIATCYDRRPHRSTLSQLLTHCWIWILWVQFFPAHPSTRSLIISLASIIYLERNNNGISASISIQQSYFVKAVSEFRFGYCRGIRSIAFALVLIWIFVRDVTSYNAFFRLLCDAIGVYITHGVSPYLGIGSAKRRRYAG